MGGPAPKRRRSEAHSTTGAAAAAAASAHATASLAVEERGAATDFNTDRVVVLNVGGTLVTTLLSTLCSSPSKLAEWAKDDFRDFPRDLQGHPFLDRDPFIFGHIINYLRGYGLPTLPDDLVVLAEDAQHFELEALKREIGLNPPPMWRFTPGPGVREDGVEFSTSDILDLCGTEPLSTGMVHAITFRMDKCELVSVGVVAFKDVQLDMQIRRQKNSVCYCNTGEFVRYWSTDALYDQGVLYKSQDEITVRVAFAQPGVPLETSAQAATADGAVMPPLQPALQLAEPLPSSVAMAGESTAGTAARASAVTFATATNTPSLSALPPGSPAVEASASRGAAPQPPTTRGPGSATAAPVAVGSPAMPATAAPTASPGTGSAAPAPGTSTGTAGTAAAAAGAPPSPSLTAAPLVLDPEDADAEIGAVVTFFKGDKEVCRARWPAPVPPLQFAVSMQGASAVSIVKASSALPGATTQ